MAYKLKPNFFFVIIALIVGVALFKQIDFENLKIEKPALAVVYIIALIISVGLILKKSKK